MDAFEQFWLLYPRRDGPNPKHPARLMWENLIKKGIDPRVILDATEKFRTWCQLKRKVDTEWVPHARTWLYQQRFEGYSAVKSDPVKIGDTMGSGKWRHRWDGSDWKHDPDVATQ